ncbi:MAG: hypothetical protein ACXVPU_06770 [Bacteroidia bacterium]
MKYIISILLIYLLPSCSIFYKVAFGIKNPKMENYNSITEYAKTLTINPNALVFSKDSLSNTELNIMFNGSPEVLIFNKSKKFLPYKNDSVACNGPVGLFLKNICNIESNHAPIRRKINYNNLLSLLDDHNDALKELNDTTIDFIVFADFAKYAPKVNKTHIIDWNNELKEHNGNCKTKIIYVNLDYLESWRISKKSLPRLRLKANKK